MLVLASLALAQIWADDALLVALAIFLLTPWSSAIASFEMSFWILRWRRLGASGGIELFKDYSALRQYIAFVNWLLRMAYFASEGIRISHQNLFFGLQSFFFMLLAIWTPSASAATVAKPIILETLTVQFQAARTRAVARLGCAIACLDWIWFGTDRIWVELLNFCQYLPCHGCFLDCWLMPFSWILWRLV